MKRSFLLFFFVLFGSSLQADLESIVHQIKEKVEDTKCHVRYYGPYAGASALGATAFVGGKKLGACVLAGLGVYGLHAAYFGYKDIKALEKKYALVTKSVDYWNNFYPEEQFLFCRWRQLDDRYGDGFYWPTAWLCHEERHAVRSVLIRDIHAQRIVYTYQGKKIQSPKPSQVIAAVNAELLELEQDKRRLQAYTPIHRTVEQPEAFHPDMSWRRILWPNYNKASKLYIEIVQMMKRLEVIRDIVAQIRSEVSGDRWPRA